MSNKRVASQLPLVCLQAGDITGGADFARAKRHKKLTARLSGAQVKSRSARLRSQAMYVLLFLVVMHTAAFAATRVLISQYKQHITQVQSRPMHESLAECAERCQGQVYSHTTCSTQV